jgi:hypothetical protein
VKTFAPFSVALASLLAGCSSASLAFTPALIGTTSGGTTASQPQIGTSCGATAVVDACASVGLICDLISARCRQPEMGEPCTPAMGCATDAPNPSSLSCVTADLNGTGVSICLVRCLGTDSASCPYGTSCYSNYCRAQGPASCVPGELCQLGERVVGQCVSDGTAATCLSIGKEITPYASCNPYALNSQFAELCGAGLICRASALTLGGYADAGFCFPLCGQGCQPDEHCAQPANAFYQICRPGLACTIDLDTCPAPESVCLPDDDSGLSGGCLPVESDAGAPGAACQSLDAIPETSPCQEGACVPADAGSVCTPLCNRTAGARPYCLKQDCEALGGDANSVVGACR